MSVRQYIGARYITKIYENSLDPSSAEWEASVNYEPLTMVTYNNGSYLSKKTVPASVGNPADNPTYWAQTGFYNGQIASLQQDILDIKTDILPLTRPKKYIFISDSYGAHPDINNSWIMKTVNLLGLNSSDYYSWYEGSTGFIHVGNDGNTFLTLAQSHESDISDPDDITDVIMVCGVNDAYYIDDYGVSTLSTAIDTFCSYIKTTYPNATFRIGCGGNWVGKTNNQADALMKLPLLYSASAITIGGKYIKNIEYILHNYSLFENVALAQHPNANGSLELARSVVANIADTEYNYTFTHSGTFTGMTNVSLAASNTFYLRVFNNEAILTINGGRYTLGTSISAVTDYQWASYDGKLLGEMNFIKIPGILTENFNNSIEANYKFGISDLTSPTGGVMKITTSSNGSSLADGACPSIQYSFPTILL